MAAYFYILKCSDGTYYTGITNNIDRRITEHSRKRGSKYTKLHGVDSLVYFENYDNMVDARKREIQVKGWSQSKKEMLIYKWDKDRNGRKHE